MTHDSSPHPHVTLTLQDNSSPGSSNGSLPKGLSPLPSRRNSGAGAGEAKASSSSSSGGPSTTNATNATTTPDGSDQDKDKGDNLGADKSSMPHTKTFVGTVTFMAPERIDGR